VPRASPISRKVTCGRTHKSVDQDHLQIALRRDGARPAIGQCFPTAHAPARGGVTFDPKANWCRSDLTWRCGMSASPCLQETV
jgi:hypothetical protein